MAAVQSGSQCQQANLTLGHAWCKDRLLFPMPLCSSNLNLPISCSYQLADNDTATYASELQRQSAGREAHTEQAAKLEQQRIA